MRMTTRQLAWMVAIWLASVATLGIAAFAIRLLVAPHAAG